MSWRCVLASFAPFFEGCVLKHHLPHIGGTDGCGFAPLFEGCVLKHRGPVGHVLTPWFRPLFLRGVC